MAKAERAFNEKDILTEGYERVLVKCLYQPQQVVCLWTAFFKLATNLGFSRRYTRDGQFELERCGYYWTGD